MIKEYCMAIKAKHTIKSNRRLYTKQQKKIMLNLLTNIVSIYNENKVTSGSIALDDPIDTNFLWEHTHMVHHPVMVHPDSVYLAKNGKVPPKTQPYIYYRSIIKWGITFFLKVTNKGKHVEYVIVFN